MGQVYVFRAHWLERAKKQVRLLWEHGDVSWAPTIGTRMRDGELTIIDLESLIEAGTVTEIEPIGRGARRYTICGVSPAGRPAKFTIEIFGHGGIITEVVWLA